MTHIKDHQLESQQAYPAAWGFPQRQLFIVCGICGATVSAPHEENIDYNLCDRCIIAEANTAVYMNDWINGRATDD